jgi:hypothetical protein
VGFGWWVLVGVVVIDWLLVVVGGGRRRTTSECHSDRHHQQQPQHQPHHQQQHQQWVRVLPGVEPANRDTVPDGFTLVVLIDSGMANHSDNVASIFCTCHTNETKHTKHTKHTYKSTVRTKTSHWLQPPPSTTTTNKQRHQQATPPTSNVTTNNINTTTTTTTTTPTTHNHHHTTTHPHLVVALFAPLQQPGQPMLRGELRHPTHAAPNATVSQHHLVGFGPMCAAQRHCFRVQKGVL